MCGRCQGCTQTPLHKTSTKSLLFIKVPLLLLRPPPLPSHPPRPLNSGIGLRTGSAAPRGPDATRRPDARNTCGRVFATSARQHTTTLPPKPTEPLAPSVPAGGHSMPRNTSKIANLHRSCPPRNTLVTFISLPAGKHHLSPYNLVKKQPNPSAEL